jgi:hypothetical protein
VVRKAGMSFLVALFLLGWSPAALSAKPATRSIPFSSGWSMIGGPPGTGLSTARALYVYGPRGYTRATRSEALLCAGEWAFFSSPTSIPLDGSTPTNTTQTCSLEAGWNMVANPFTADALLPDGTTAYDWDAAANRYDAVSVIPAGRAVWIHADVASSLNLVNAAAPPVAGAPPPPIPIPSPIYIGETFKIILPDELITNIPRSAPYTALFDPARLRLEEPGVTSTEHYWTFLALTAGSTEVHIEPACRLVTPPCIHGTELFIPLSIDDLPA